MSLLPENERLNWGPALRYYGLLLLLLGGGAVLARWQHWPALPPWGQALLVLVTLVVSFWPIVRLSREPRPS